VKINLANRITLARIFLVPLLAVALLYHANDIALAIFIVAALTDAADGIVARRLNQRTTLGAILDPAADKAMLLTAFILMAQQPEPHISLPHWIVAIVVSREVLIIVGIGIIHLVTHHITWGPSWLSKVNTNAQIFTVVTVALANALIDHGVGSGIIVPLEGLLGALISVTLVTTVASGVDYTLRGVRMLSEQTDALEPPSRESDQPPPSQKA
jgi:cardiolipin synthase